MKLLKNYTQEEVLNLISKISLRIAKKFPIPGYEPEDIQQECYLMALDAVERYDEQLPLENFLSIHLRNRVINFRRDKYLRKQSLLDAECIDYVEDEILDYTDAEIEVESRELWDRIDTELPASLREDYLRLLDGASIPSKRKKKLIEALAEICQESEDFLKKI
jgi:DNA-directed RNA polymerase specialized sigma24 family protein